MSLSHQKIAPDQQGGDEYPLCEQSPTGLGDMDYRFAEVVAHNQLCKVLHAQCSQTVRPSRTKKSFTSGLAATHYQVKTCSTAVPPARTA